MEAQIAVRKIGKYATSESGDTLEMVERPAGGLSFVLVDGQRSGKAAKSISNVVARKAISLLAEGVRDGAAARAASDYLYTYRAGKVLATLNILSIDLNTQSMVIVRNNPAPVILIQEGELRSLDAPCYVVGTRRNIRPEIEEIPLQAGLGVVVYSDGLVHAGDRYGRPMDVATLVQSLFDQGPQDAGSWADRLMQHALDLDQNRPSDDISVLVARICAETESDVRHLDVRVPLS